VLSLRYGLDVQNSDELRLQGVKIKVKSMYISMQSNDLGRLLIRFINNTLERNIGPNTDAKLQRKHL
jgi:hypothetical protein